MSDFDVNLIKALDLRASAVAGYIGVTPPSLSVGLKNSKVYFGLERIEALRENKRLKGKIITSATLFGEGYDLIKKGIIFGSVLQSPGEDARLALRVSVKVAKGETVPFYNFIPLEMIKNSNLMSISRPDF